MNVADLREPVSPRKRSAAILAALVALFLGALDSLVMSAAMPSIVAELGGLPLYAWVYSAYFLARAISLPVFGKLADIYDNKKIFLLSISLFILASISAGLADSMLFLIFSRLFQGIGAGGNFALVYIVLSRVASPGNRAQTLSLGSTVWGISSVIGPTLGGFIVSYFSWRWIFFINLPIGLLSLAGIALYLRLPHEKRENRPVFDYGGVSLFSISVLGLLMIFTTGGRDVQWFSFAMLALVITTSISGILFCYVEKKAINPMIEMRLFARRNFSLGNGATFLASFAIFSFFAYAPLYIQGSLGLSPMQVGIAMVSLSLGWSFGSLYFGRASVPGNERRWAIWGASILLVGSLQTLRFHLDTAIYECFLVFFIIGIGMGLVSLATLILVQNCVSSEDLGVATSFHQFSRTLGGTIGVGVCGGVLNIELFRSIERSSALLPEELLYSLKENVENLLLTEFQQGISEGAVEVLRGAVLSGVSFSFIVCTIASLLCLICCLLLTEATSVNDSAR